MKQHLILKQAKPANSISWEDTPPTGVLSEQVVTVADLTAQQTHLWTASLKSEKVAG